MKKEKVPSKFNVWMSTIINIGPNYINLSKKGCGRAENRTRNHWLTSNYFTIKLLAHNERDIALNYLNIQEHF
jgi:hypothetical protein